MLYMSNVSHKFQYTKSIGFSLKGDIDNFIPNDEKENNAILFQDFKNQYKILITVFKNTVFFETDEGILEMKKRLEIKYPWLRQYAKDRFYENNLNTSTDKIFTIKNADFLQEIFIKWIQKNEAILKKIEKVIDQPLETQKKYSDLAFYLRSIFSSDYFFFVKDLPQYAKDKDSDFYMKELEKSIPIFNNLLEQCLDILSPNQTTGVEVARASFNFYTINKTSKYIDGKTVNDILEEKKREQETPYKNNSSLDKNFLKKIGFEKYSAHTPQELTFQELYSALKDFRATQKKDFNESIYQEKWKEEIIEGNENTKKIKTKGTVNLAKIEKNKKFSFDDFLAQAGVEREITDPKIEQEERRNNKKKQIKQFVQKKFPLFDTEEDIFFKFVELTEEIKELGNKKNTAKGFEVAKIAKKLREKRKKRSEYFIKPWGFKNYSQKYCNTIYKKVAMDFGKLKAEIRGMEQEKIESRLLNYWAHILEKNNEKHILLIPKIEISNAKKFLEKTQNTITTSADNTTIISFNSFTLRALDKIIRKNYPKEISQQAGNIPFETYAQKIECYKKALNGELTKLKLDFSGFAEKISSIIEKNYKTVEDFRIDFEKISYSLREKKISESDIEILKNKFGAIISKITSYDLERNIGKKREHTKYWHNFWTDENKKENFPIRLNPELRIFYRKPLEQNDEKKQKNRFSKEHFRISFTLTQNAAKKELKTTFANEKDLIEKIKIFNAEVIGDFIQKTGENLWYFGIDRGNQELATLGVVKWTKEEYEATLSNGEKKIFCTPEFPEIEVFEIKNPEDTKTIINDAKGTKITVKISDNPSYFMNDEEEIEKYFTKETVAFIDLTTAKVIKGKIILNGDVKTYINLKKANAKRKLFDIFTQIDDVAHIEYCDENHQAWNIETNKGLNIFRNAFVIKKQDNQYQILCYFLPKQSKVYSRNNLQNDLQEYLNSLKKDGLMQEHTIQQINNLRDAITANMVGIISFLHEKYPAIINLENLQTKKHIDNHRTKNEESIARRLEWALYRKFQKKGLVPPNLKQTIFLREDSTNPLNQFGIIHFIPTTCSSSRCPRCLENAITEKRKEDKWDKHRYECTNTNCRFSTDNNSMNFIAVTNSDESAACNIANPEFEKRENNCEQKDHRINKKEKSSRSRPSNRGRK